jgi:NAD(P) transhydrogenase
LAEKYDLIVIGAGPAGEKGASKAAQYGKRVALIERAPYPGGAGIKMGTVPSKTLRESALSDSYQDAAYEGLANHAGWLEANK